MTRYVEHLVDAWAEVWSSGDDGARSFARIYARDVVWWDAARGRGTERAGYDALSAARDAALAGATRLRIATVRLVPGDAWTVVEFVALSPEPAGRAGAPGCAWLRLDDDGRIAREHWYWEWARRRPATPALAGHAAAGGGGDRTSRWYRDFAAAVIEAWDADPPAMVDSFYARDVVFDTMGAGPDLVIRGADALRAAECRIAELLVERQSKVGEVAGAGPVVAFTHFTEARTVDGERRTTPATRVLTLDDDDRVIGDHAYLLRAWKARGRG